jgi:hypothetical protein
MDILHDIFDIWGVRERREQMRRRRRREYEDGLREREVAALERLAEAAEKGTSE